MKTRKAYKFRIFPTKTQTTKLETTLWLCRELYNAALQERRDAYRMVGKSLNYYDQADHFSSKDDLIDAYLVGRDQVFWDEVEKVLLQYPDSPRQQLEGLFEGFEGLLSRPEFTGCPFLSANAEFPELDQPGHRVALVHKQKMRFRFQELTRKAGVKNPDQLADQLVLLVDGAFASKKVYRNMESPAQQLKAAALMLLEAHLK